MPLLQFGGVSSGLDTRGIIDALMGVERQPFQRLQTARGQLTLQKDAYGKLSTALADLLAKLKAFTVSRAAASRGATSSDPAAFTASATTSAILGQYQVSVDRLATATRATSQAAVGTAITDATATAAMASLQLPGSVTAGQVSLVVDGTIVRVTVGDPATTSLQTTMNAIASALQAQIQTTDATATVSASVVNNRMRFAMSGAASSHDIRFGVAGDASNALGIFGLAGQQATFTNAAPIDGSSALGVVRTSGTLDAAGLTGLTSTASGVLTINGVAISYDTTTESLSTITSRINNSQAGVIASLDRTNDKITLARNDAGPLAIDIVDTSGSLGAALNLAPGTTSAQTIGETSQVTVDGRAVTSDGNRVTSAIDGVTLDLLATTTSAKTLTVSTDRTAIRNAVNGFVTSFNALADQLDSLTRHAAGQAAAALERDLMMRGLLLDLRNITTRPASGWSGSITSLADIGVSTGAIGSALGTTKRFALDEAKLTAALDTDPARVAQLLNEATGVLQPLVDRITAITGTGGPLEASRSGLDSRIKGLDDRGILLERRLDAKRTILERKYAALESTLSLLQTQSSQLNAQVQSFNRQQPF